jgi:hypothetical protein
VAYEIGRARLKQIAGSKAVESLPESGRGGRQQ